MAEVPSFWRSPFRPTWTRYGRNKNQDDLLAYQAGDRIIQFNLCDDVLPTRGSVVGTGTSPTYSPDGLWLGYQSGRNIWKVRNSGSGATMVHGTSLDERDPSLDIGPSVSFAGMIGHESRRA